MKWPTAPIRKVAPAEASLIHFSPTDVVWHLSLDQIESNTGYIINKKTALASEAGTSTYVFDEGNVLYSKLRPYLNKVVCPTEPGIATTELVPLRPRSEVLDRRFLMYYLRSRHFLAFANTAVAGVKMPRLIMDKFWKHHIPLPPLSEQRRIVEILDQGDALRKKRAEADAKAARILPALFYKMFGDPAMNPKGWPTDALAKFANVQGGFAFKSADFIDSGVLLVRIGNLIDGEVRYGTKSAFLPKDFLNEYKRYVLVQGDLLIALTGATTGKLARFSQDFPALLNQRVGRLIPLKGKMETLDYLHLLMQTEYAQNYIWQYARGFGQPNIAPRQIESMIIPIPPENLILTFSKLAQGILRNRTKQNIAVQNIEKSFLTLLHRAFTGDLTAQWREAHMKELLEEMEQQAKALETTNHTKHTKGETK